MESGRLPPPTRCDLHVHSRFSTDSGSIALRRVRIGESFTDPARVDRVCRARGMDFVTISDHNTLDGALRIAEGPGTFLSEEVTTRFPEDDLPLHVLVWNLTEDDHRDLQPSRPSVYELVDFLRTRGLRHALAHPLYRMGPPITASHVERMMLLFDVWEGRNGARPAEQNELACRLAGAVGPSYLDKLAQRHGMTPRHAGRIALTGGSDDHAALDIGTTWTEGPASCTTVEEFLDGVCEGFGEPGGEHGSTLKLAHALVALGAGAYRDAGGRMAEPWSDVVAELLDQDAEDAAARHAEIAAVAARAARQLAASARRGGFGPGAIGGAGGRLAALAAAGAVQLPYLATAHHHAGSRSGLRSVEEAFFGLSSRGEPRALVFTDTFDETNGVAGTMRRLAWNTDGTVTVVTSRAAPSDRPGLLVLEPEWSLPLPTYETVELRVPSALELLALVEAERPDVIHLATPGPVGLLGLLAARLLGVPVVGSYHTELGPYALHLTRDVLVAEATGAYVDWFYRQADIVLAPTGAVAAALAERGLAGRVAVWGRSVDTERFSPRRRHAPVRRRFLDGGDTLLLSVGRVSPEKRLDVLLEAFAQARAVRDGLRLVVAGDGPAREELERRAPDGVRFVGEIRGLDLARLYASADVFCFPSTTDTFGQVLVEAGAAGLPVVAARAGGARELVADWRTGLLVRGDDAPAFAGALLALADDAERRAEMGAAGRTAALERSWERSLGELRHAYRAVVDGHGVRPRELVV
jgi:glycosyltransferase involved in cell wall biosynthesis/predicted metal-dependent phosphoesterase TrpH